jgi:excinuclease UvrABC nuclease subunit
MRRITPTWSGRNNGNRAFFPSHTRAEELPVVLGAFIAQFYDDKPPPPLLLLSHAIPEEDLVAEALSLKAGRRVEITVPQRGEKRAVVEHAETNAREALERRLAESAGQAKLLEATAALFGLPGPPERIEVYDNSHIMGANAYGVMIVAGAEGFTKQAYRKFLIRGPITPGDDFAMMREMLEHRFACALREAEQGVAMPDLVLIDGGAGQLSAARQVLQDRGCRTAAGGDRQGAGPRRRARMVPYGRTRAVPAAAARSGAVFPAAPAPRGAPLRHHHAPRRPVKNIRQSELDEVPGSGRRASGRC